MDKKWEDADIDSCVDVCLITGQPGPTDSGRNEIILCGRIEDSCYRFFPKIHSKNTFSRTFFLTVFKKTRIFGTVCLILLVTDQDTYK
jgi:hypothetical protein